MVILSYMSETCVRAKNNTRPFIFLFDQTMVMRLPEISTQFLPYARVSSIRYMATCKTSTEGIDENKAPR
jgi:hypothetical protein